MVKLDLKIIFKIQVTLLYIQNKKVLLEIQNLSDLDWVNLGKKFSHLIHQTPSINIMYNLFVQYS